MNSNKLDNREIIDDPNAVSRKKDHISLAFESQINSKEIDNRFYYEPFLALGARGDSPPQLRR